MAAAFRSPDFRDMIRDFAREGSYRGLLRTRLLDTVGDEVKEMEGDVQRNARLIRARGPKSTGLRRGLARATNTQVKPPVLVVLQVSRSRMPQGQHGLPALMEGLNLWRHPTFDKRPVVTQQPHPFFRPATDDAERRCARAADRVAHRVVIRLERG